jgi:hypothetical protein
MVNALPAWTRYALRVNGAVLTLGGLVTTVLALVATATGRSFGTAAMAQVVSSVFYRSGWIESHGLAAVVGAVLLRASFLDERRFFHGVAIATHALLGGTNLLCWQGASAEGMYAVAVGSTALHFILVSVHALALVSSRDTARSP